MKKLPLSHEADSQQDRLALVQTIISEDYMKPKGQKRDGSVSDLVRLIALEKELSECLQPRTPIVVRWVETLTPEATT